MRALRGPALNVPDGRPLVWALNTLGEHLPDRVYGPELMDRYCGRAAERGHRVWLYGGHTPRALEQLVAALRDRHPQIAIVGAWSPPHRPLTTDEEREVAERINHDRPDVVWVGIGVPKQEKWMARMRPLLEAPVLVGVGAAFDFLAGRKRQAPPWMQRRGLEWLFRLSQEPRRLVGRYLRYNPAFVAAFARQYLREGRGTGL
jgi:N-acetylglucosaminyldiphosphoundecaprenol N-acetyl-beta-D-mannosaminyltransferase